MQLSGLFDTFTFTAFLQALRKAAAEPAPPQQQQQAKEKSVRGKAKVAKRASQHNESSADEAGSGDDSEADNAGPKAKPAGRRAAPASSTQQHGEDPLSVCVHALVDLASFLKVGATLNGGLR